MALLVKLNDEVIEVDTAGVETLSDLLREVSGKRFEPHELIVDIEIDGKPVEEGSWESLKEAPVSGMSSVSISTIKSLEEKTVQLLREMNIYLERLMEGMEEVADAFRMGASEKANSMLYDALEGLSAFTEIIQTAKSLAKTDLSDLSLNNETMSSQEERLLAVLKSVKSGQEDSDWVSVADLMEYELAPLIEKWREFIPMIESELLKEKQ